MSEIILGIEEAGRGPVVGDIVIVGLSVEKSKEDELRKIGVKDSKILSPEQRKKLAKKIEKIAKDVVIIKVSPCKIDGLKKKGINLNRLEAMKFAYIINMIKPKSVFIDCPDTNYKKFALTVKKMLEEDTKLFVEHKADSIYPIVSAASIIAKVERDAIIEELRKKYGLRGSGYSHDEETIQWLREWLQKNNELPVFVRKSWDTARRLLAEKQQNRLSAFFSSFIKKRVDDCAESKNIFDDK